jgi:hypothetical protein
VRYYGRRYFQPANGRFLGRDPIDESGGLNLYGFCGNNGVNRWDVLGMYDGSVFENSHLDGVITEGSILPPAGGYGPIAGPQIFWHPMDDMALDPLDGTYKPAGAIMWNNVDFMTTAQQTGADHLAFLDATGAFNKPTVNVGTPVVVPNSLTFNYKLGTLVSPTTTPELFGGNQSNTQTGGSRLGNAFAGLASGALAGATTGGAAGALSANPGNALLGMVAGGIAGGVTGFVQGLTAPPSTSTGTIVNNAAVTGYFTGLTGPQFAAGVSAIGSTLPNSVAATFSGGGYSSSVLQVPMTVSRYSGGVSGPVGRFLTDASTVSRISSPAQAISALNLPAGATAQTLNTFVIPAGTRIFVGGVQGGATWATQIFVRNPSVLLPK